MNLYYNKFSLYIFFIHNSLQLPTEKNRGCCSTLSTPCSRAPGIIFIFSVFRICLGAKHFFFSFLKCLYSFFYNFFIWAIGFHLFTFVSLFVIFRSCIAGMHDLYMCIDENLLPRCNNNINQSIII